MKNSKLADRTKQFFKTLATNAAIATALLGSGCAVTQKQVQEAKKPVKRITINDTAGVPSIDAFASVEASTSSKKHSAGVRGYVNPTRLAGIKRVPLTIESYEGLNWERGKSDARFWSQDVKLSLGYDSIEDSKDFRINVLPEFGYATRRDLSGEAAIKQESAFSLGGKGTLALPVGEGYLRLALRGAKFVDGGSGEYRSRDGQGERVKLALDGHSFEASALYTMELPELMEKGGLLLGANAGFADVTRKASGKTSSGSELTADDNLQTILAGGEIGIYTTDAPLTEGFASLSLIGGLSKTKEKLSYNFAQSSTSSEDAPYVGLRVRQQILDKWFLGVEGKYLPKQKEAQGAFSFVYLFGE
ncbi:hypothetical protein D6825_02760 [Candidatus Woesearchaeota archaeon]|nr:MAG: hypothetical protein D6825_02760 [Candidatus Woesearchaeota archaeon]